MQVPFRECNSHFFQFPAIKNRKEIIVTAIRLASVEYDNGEYAACVNVYTGERFRMHPDALVNEVVFADFRTE